MTLLMNRPQDAFGPLLKSWRTRRRLSQLDLALDAGLSQRHLSFLETGRSKPSRYAIRQICEALDMPAAERDIMLMSAGFAPQSAHASWSDDVRDAVTTSIAHVLKGHEPFPAVSIDRIWNLQQANASAERFFAIAGATGDPNLLREIFSPGPLRSNIGNWPEVARALLRLLDLEVARRPHDDAAKALLDDLKDLPGVAAAIADRPKAHPAPVLSIHFTIEGAELRLFSLIATVGMSMDATLDDVRLETLLPADEATRRWFADLSP
ncbi:helix-turn-helix domain-containing protein [Yoonia litorea]|uniref:Transcriptional regulator, XRE family n=1 Tax=Yoonia litorea TaxID=1123755 RepID=A0A1I6L5J8_9RHOB|nr:helix-turn-helix transcriptional regulator [Yoonia litorea]SFR98540.1 transcriptional regulator, XRE family [Yoonia litorea]